MAKGNKGVISKFVMIMLLIAWNIYVYAVKAIPKAISEAGDLRYKRVHDLIFDHYWEGVEEFPSMLFCLFPLGLFPDRHSAAVFWVVANFVFMGIILYCLRKTVFKACDKVTFTIWALFFTSLVPVCMTFQQGQNLMYSFSFFMIAYTLVCYDEEREESSPLWKRILIGIVLGLSFFKYSIIFFLLPIFIYKRRFVELITSVLMHLLLTFFSMWWLGMSFIQIILSPITSSVSINTGKGFIDLMTILSGGFILPEFFGTIHGNILYYIVFVVAFIIMLAIATKRSDSDETRVFALYCALSTVLIYHRQYDSLVLIIPIYLSCGELFRSIKKKQVMRTIIYFIAVLGTGCIVYGNWVFQLLYVAIDYGIGQKMFYGLSFIGIYLLCGILLVDSIQNRKMRDV